MIRSVGARSRQRGQALVFVAITTVMVLLGVLILYNVAQLTTQKMKLQNTADAAVYSGVLSEARDYNFTAYANRAMVANQVAVTQIVGLTSWARNLDNVYNTGDFHEVPQVFADLSALGAMWTAVWDVVAVAAEGIKSAVDLAGPLLVKGLDILMDLLSAGTTAYHAAMVLTVPQVIEKVIEKNDPDAQLSTSLTQIGFAALHVKDVYDFTSQYKPQATSGKDADTSGSSTDRFANVTFNSEDGFYNFRSYPWPLPILIDPTKAIPGNYGTMFMIMYHSGGTEMKETVNSKKFATYTGLDATGLFVILMVWIFVPFPVPIPIPLPLPQGYGASYCGQGSGSSLLQPTSNNFNHTFTSAYGSTFVNPLTIAPGYMQVSKGPGTNMDSNCGLKPYWDVTNRGQASATANQNATGPSLLLEVVKPISKVAQSNSPAPHLNVAGGDTTSQLYLADGTENSRLVSMTKAETYFSRPKKLFARDDGKTEYGSLYNPYWQVHLLPNSTGEQAASMLGQTWP